MAPQSFVYGALILVVAGFFNRLIGFIYQIFMIRLIEPEGVGLFNMVYPIYIMALVLAGAGIPVAIAKLVAEEVAKNNLKGAYRIFYTALAYIFFTSFFITSLLIAGAPFLKTHLFPRPDAHACFFALIPAITIVSLCSAFRGFFQGLQQMAPTAVTQVAEQIVRISAGLTIAYLLLPKGVAYAAAGLSLGVVCGEFIGFIFILWIYLARRPVLRAFPGFKPERLGLTTFRIFQLAVPVTLTRFISTALLSIDALLIPRRLTTSGLSLSEATAMYGQLVGIAEPLLFIPSIITISLATALVPAMSDALAQNNLPLVRGRCEEAIRLTMLAGLPAATVLLLLPEEFCTLFFGYGEAALALSVLAIGGPFLYLQQTTIGILQGLGRADRPLQNLVIASLFKITGIYYLTAIPGVNIQGAALSLVTGYVIMSMLNYRDLKSITKIRPDWHYVLSKPLLASLGMAVVIWQAKENIPVLIASPVLQLASSMLLGGTAYLVLLVITGGLHIYDLNRLKELLKLFTLR
ncbi:MAG: stage V sporulation protein B [Bacillota bacterium]